MSEELAPAIPTTRFIVMLSWIRLLGMALTYENPLIWSAWTGKKNKQADMEGPYYVIGAPNRQIGEGKAILTSKEILKKFKPFLMVVRILTPEGKPVPNAVIHWWQADTDGNYTSSSYSLRGQIKTDQNGSVEVLTVAPGMYGPAGRERAGHFHLIIDVSGQRVGLESLTSQIYVCPGNDPKALSTDFLNFVRRIREGNMVHGWSIASANGGQPFMNLPELSSNDYETNWKSKVEWWNSTLPVGVEVVAGGRMDFYLSSRTRWL